MEKRDSRQSSCSPQRRHRKQSCSRSYSISSSSDTNSHFLSRSRDSRSHNARRCHRRKSPRCIIRTHERRRFHVCPSNALDKDEDTECNDTCFMTQRRINHQGKEATDREVCDVDDTVASRSVFRRTAPNASALQSIMLGTARSRDRMDECERARAKKKLEHLNATVKKH